MKTRRLISFICLLFVAVELCPAQVLTPGKAFIDDARTHNMHLASDGRFLYTCNGGNAGLGQISKFTPEGVPVANFKLALDMRSLMFSPSGKKLYAYTYDRKLVAIDNLSQGTYTEIHNFPDRSAQSVPALSANGRKIYFMEFGHVYIYKMKSGKLKATLTGIETSGDHHDGATTIAVSKRRIYSWNADNRQVYCYSLKGKLIQTYRLAQGNYGFSLSWADGLLWVAKDGDYDTGTWYGYALK